MKEDIQWFAREIFYICFENNITLKMDCIPRSQNTLVDWASREADLIVVEDLGLTDCSFRILNNQHGLFTLDTFGNFYNSMC